MSTLGIVIAVFAGAVFGACVGYFLGHALGYQKGRNDYRMIVGHAPAMGSYTGPAGRQYPSDDEGVSGE